MYPRYVTITIATLVLVSCSSDPTWDEVVRFQYKEVLSKLEFECDLDAISENYATAIIQGDTSCYHDGVNGYYFGPGFEATFVTTSPNVSTTSSSGISRSVSLRFSPGNRPFTEIFKITFEGFPNTVTYAEIADSVFRVGVAPFSYEKYDFAIQSAKEYGVKIDVISRYQEAGGGLSGYSISSSYGHQPMSSSLEFVEVKKKELPDEILYNLKLKFNCLLFHDYRFGNDELFGELESGYMAVSISVPRGK